MKGLARIAYGDSPKSLALGILQRSAPASGGREETISLAVTGSSKWPSG